MLNYSAKAYIKEYNAFPLTRYIKAHYAHRA